ncbi:hypothetical protein [Cupriavidus necator]|nr:hypothetical protein [Cupriavidus necator]
MKVNKHHHPVLVPVEGVREELQWHKKRIGLTPWETRQRRY